MLGWLTRSPPVPIVLPLTVEHAERAAALHALAFARPWDRVEFERLLCDRSVVADGLFLGAEDVPAGFVLSRVVLDEAEILTVTIAPEARGQGYAGALLKQHFEGLARAGARTVHLEVEEGNVPALALYRRLGFQVTGQRPAYYRRPDGTAAHACTMSLTL